MENKKINFNWFSVIGFLILLFGLGFFTTLQSNVVKADVYLESSQGKQVYCYKLNNDNFESDNYNNSIVIYPYEDINNFTYVYCLTNPYKSKQDLVNGYVYEYSFLNRFYYCSNINDKYSQFNLDWDYQNNRLGVYFTSNTPYYNFNNIFIFSTLTLQELIDSYDGSLDYDLDYSLDSMFDLIDINIYSNALKYYQFNNTFTTLIDNARQEGVSKGIEIGKEIGRTEASQPFTFLSVVSNFLNYEFMPNFKFSYLVAIGLGFGILMILIKSVLK